MKLLIAFLFLLNMQLYSQIKFIGNPTSGGYINSTKYFSQHKTFNHIFFTMGDDGTLIKSNENGENALFINTPLYNNIITPIPHISDSTLLYFDDWKSYFDNRDIFRSDDLGQSVIKIKENATTDLSVNPLNNNIILAGNNNELWRSDDRGDNWRKIYTFERKVYSIAVSETDTSLVYASIFSGIRRSTDSGLNWEVVYDTTGGVYFEFTDIKIHPSESNIVYAKTARLYKFNAAIKTMKPVSGPIEVYGYALDPVDTNTIFIAGNYSDETLFKTEDEGENWKPLSSNMPVKGIWSFNIWIDYRDRNTIYADVYEAGILKSTDGGVNWSRTNFTHDKTSQMDFGASNRLYTVGGSWGLLKTDDEGGSWDVVEINPDSLLYKKPDYLAVNPFNRSEGYLTINHKLLKTTNNGGFFTQEVTSMGWTYIKYNTYFQNVLYAIKVPGYDPEYGIFKSTDNGNSWVINSYFAVPKSFSPFNVNKVYHGAHDEWGIGVLYVSTDGGKQWTNNTTGLRKYSGSTEPLPVSVVAPSMHDSNVVYCGQWGEKGSISKSTNGGDSWFQIDANFPEQNKYIHCMLLDKNIPGRFYVGAQSGLYLTENDGQTLRKLFNKNVYDLMMDESSPPNLYFNTHAGVLKIKDTVTVGGIENTFKQPENFVLYQNYPNPFNPITKIKYTLPKRSNVTLNVYDALGRKAAVLADGEKPAGEHSVEFNASDLSSGVYFYQLITSDFMITRKMLLLK